MNYNTQTPRKSLNKTFLKMTLDGTQTDRIIYKLYGLAEEEIKIVKGGVE